MTPVAIFGPDESVLDRWSEQLRNLGQTYLTVPTPALIDVTDTNAGRFLWDLGPRGGADTAALLAAVKAFPATRFIAMSARPEAGEGLRLLRAGVRGYSNRLCATEVLGALLSTVENGEIWAGRQVTEYLLNTAIAQEPAALEAPPEATGAVLLQGLTSREAEIAGQVAAGLSNKVIAIENGITERTVKAHLNSIFRKTGIRNRVQLALVVSQGERGSRKILNG